MTAWTTSTVVKEYALVKWDSLNYATNSPFSGEVAFGTFIDDYILPEAQAHINAFCKRDFDDYDTIPTAIQGVAARVAANLIQIMVMNRAGPLVRVSDYKIALATQDPITPELKAVLNPWVKRSFQRT